MESKNFSGGRIIIARNIEVARRFAGLDTVNIMINKGKQ